MCHKFSSRFFVNFTISICSNREFRHRIRSIFFYTIKVIIQNEMSFEEIRKLTNPSIFQIHSFSHLFRLIRSIVRLCTEIIKWRRWCHLLIRCGDNNGEKFAKQKKTLSYYYFYLLFSKTIRKWCGEATENNKKHLNHFQFAQCKWGENKSSSSCDYIL